MSKCLVHQTTGKTVQVALKRGDVWVNEVEAAFSLTLDEASYLSDVLAHYVQDMSGPTQADIDAELGADHYKGEKAL